MGKVELLPTRDSEAGYGLGTGSSNLRTDQVMLFPCSNFTSLRQVPSIIIKTDLVKAL